jgi:hypothetical protein
MQTNLRDARGTPMKVEVTYTLSGGVYFWHATLPRTNYPSITMSGAVAEKEHVADGVQAEIRRANVVLRADY